MAESTESTEQSFQNMDEDMKNLFSFYKAAKSATGIICDIDRNLKEELIRNLFTLKADKESKVYKKWTVKYTIEDCDLSQDSDDEINRKFAVCLNEQDMGSYVLNPSIWHKASSAFFTNKYPGGAMSINDLKTDIPFYDWDFCLKALARANNYDVTAHADMNGAEVPAGVALTNAYNKGICFNESLLHHWENAHTFITNFRKNLPSCFGGTLKVTESYERMGVTALISYTAAVSAHEQNLNGGWEQVFRNIYTREGHLRSLFYGIAGFLLVDDLKSAYSYANMLCDWKPSVNIDNNVEVELHTGEKVILKDMIVEYIDNDSSCKRMKFLTDMMSSDDLNNSVVDAFGKYACNLNDNLEGEPHKQTKSTCKGNHELSKSDNSEMELVCDGCIATIYGDHYCCRQCDFDICDQCRNID